MPEERSTFYGRAIEAGLLLAAFLVPLVFLPHWNTLDPTSVKATLFYLVMLVLGALWGLECAAAGRLVFRRSPLDLPILAFLAWNLLSLAWTRYDYATLTQCGKYLSYALGYFLLVTYLRTPRQVQRLITVVLASAALTGLYGLAQWRGWDWYHWTSGDVRLVSSLGNATFFAAHLVLVVPLALSLFLLARSARGRLGWGALVGLLYFCLLLTYTRAAWLGLGAALMLEAVLLVGRWRGRPSGGSVGAAGEPGPGPRTQPEPTRRARPAAPAVDSRRAGLGRPPRSTGETPVPPRLRLPALAGLAAVLVALTVVAALYGPYPLGQRLASSFQVDMSNVQRLMAWKAAGKMFLAHPLLGIGSGTLMHHLADYLDPEFYNTGVATWVAHAHNELLEQAGETGIVGVGLFLWLLGSFALVTGRAAWRAEAPPTRYLAAATLGGVLAFLVQNLAGVSLRYPTGGVYLWLMLGLGVVISHPTPSLRSRLRSPKLGEGDKRRFPVPASTLAQVLLALILAAVVALAGWQIVDRAVSDVYARAAMSEGDAGRYAEAYADLHVALVLNPYSLAAYSSLGTLALHTADYPRAVATFTALQELDADYVMLDRGLGQAYLGLGQYPEAIAAFERGARLEHSPGALTELARAYAAGGKLDQAVAAADEAVNLVEQGRPQLHLAPAEVYLRRAQILALRGDAPAAERDVARAEQLDPRNARPHLILGDLYRGRREYARALAEYRQAQALSPADAQPQVLMGLTYATLGNFEQAIDHLNAALVLQPGNDYVKVKLGAALVTAGRREEAQQELQPVIAGGGPFAGQAKEALGKGGQAAR